VLGAPAAGPDLREGSGREPDPRPPTNRGPPAKPFIPVFYFSLMIDAYENAT